jgi:hypothetical protein
MKKWFSNTALFIPMIALVACAFVSLDPQASDVAVSPNAEALSRCKFLGNTTVSLWSKAGKIQSQETMETQLDTLARNQAVKMKGNAVAPDSEIDDGQRIYRVYNCSAH